MSQVAILLWVAATAHTNGASNVRGEPTFDMAHEGRTFAYTAVPSDQQRQVLEGWADSRNLELQSPPRRPVSEFATYDASVTEQIEYLLEQARLSAGSLAEGLATEQLAEAERLIYEHAELPQAGYLLAEAASQHAKIAEGQGLPRLAEIHRLRAVTLEGPRAAAYSDNPRVQTTTHAQLRSATGGTTVVVDGLRQADVLEWDGVPQSARRFATTVGEHHARVLREGATVWAGFVVAHADLPLVAIQAPAPGACTLSDLTGITLAAERILVNEPVRCPLWVVARPANGRSVNVALCRYQDCGPLLEWQTGFGRSLAPPLHQPHPFQLPRWAGYVAAGVGAAAATTIVLWQTGAFDDPEPAPTSWRFGGVNE